jgi:hypothetical protein
MRKFFKSYLDWDVSFREVIHVGRGQKSVIGEKFAVHRVDASPIVR